MRIPRLPQRTSTALLTLSLCLIGLSTTADLLAPEPDEARQEHTTVIALESSAGAPEDDDCDAPG